MKRKLEKLFTILAAVLIFTVPAKAEWWKLAPSDLVDDSTVVTAECLNSESRFFGIVLKKGENLPADPGTRAIALDQKLVLSALGFFQNAPELEANLRLNEKNPTEAQIKTARESDTQARLDDKEILKEEHRRVGLISQTETDIIAYFSSGKSEMKVACPLKGGISVETVFTVIWKNVRVNVNAPVILPASPGALYGLAFAKQIKEGQSIKFEKSFLRKDQAIQAIDQFYHEKMYLTVQSEHSDFSYTVRRAWEQQAKQLNLIKISSSSDSEDFISVIREKDEMISIHVPSEYPFSVAVGPATSKQLFTAIYFNGRKGGLTLPVDGIIVQGREIRFLNEDDWASLRKSHDRANEAIKETEKALNEALRKEAE